MLSPKTVELMTVNHLGAVSFPWTSGTGFGPGFYVVEDLGARGLPGSVGEFGWGGAASTSFFVDPKEKLIGLLLTQLLPSRYYPIRNEFKVLVYQALVD